MQTTLESGNFKFNVAFKNATNVANVIKHDLK